MLYCLSKPTPEGGGGIPGGKKEPSADEQPVDDKDLLELLKAAAPEVKEKVLSMLESVKG